MLLFGETGFLESGTDALGLSFVALVGTCSAGGPRKEPDWNRDQSMTRLVYGAG